MRQKAKEMRLVCHIGTPKTASTFLQSTFEENAAWLKKNGIIYPRLLSPSANHITLFYAVHEGLHPFALDYGLRSRKDVIKLRSRLSDNLESLVRHASAQDHTVLVSSENLIGNLKSEKEVRNLRDLLQPHFDDITIVVYVRRQDEAILSMYGEYMRRGFNSMKFSEFVSACLGPQSLTHYLYYKRVLEMWIGVFGRDALDVRLYERSSVIDGDILTDFITRTFQDCSPCLEGMSRSSVRNAGFSGAALEFLRLLQPHVPSRKDGEVNPARLALSTKIERLPATPRPRMRRAVSQRIMDHFQPANKWLAEAFFPHLGGAPFPEKDRKGAKGDLGKITLDQFAEFTGLLLN